MWLFHCGINYKINIKYPRTSKSRENSSNSRYSCRARSHKHDKVVTNAHENASRQIAEVLPLNEIRIQPLGGNWKRPHTA